eukprot:TRINITY_DN362_c0_g1_i1.p1 TRINITY_DN362_c0_g1~~TRINITY_DN362_c0_g1_i1.p1  ORF type:complete len:664 (+),score=137.96 TRINITY_DN362_c0_g1_i1:141-1994(+)
MAKKNPKFRKAYKKDPGVPDLHEVKPTMQNRLLKKQKIEQDQVRKRNARQNIIDINRQLSPLQQMEKLAQKAERSERNFADKNLENKHGQLKDLSRRAYYREFKKVVEAADVILEVLDARDPLGSRCPSVEKEILRKDPNKKIVLLLNKIDLVPKHNVEAWLKHLRNEFPALAFKCTVGKNQNTKRGKAPNRTDNMQTSECLGADTLISLLKNYCRNAGIKTKITVGIIGFPNVGKSSLINSLKRSRAVGVGATPGFTKHAQEIHLDSNIRLLDCPGIIFSNNTSEADAALRNCVKIEQLSDIIAPIEGILKRCRPQQLEYLYKIPAFSDVTEFLANVARTRGKLKNGGVEDVDVAAKLVLQDWNEGRIPYYTIPPDITKDKSVHVGSEVVSQWGKEFDIDKILESEQNNVLSSLNSMDTAESYSAMAPSESLKVDVMFNNLDNDHDGSEVEQMMEDTGQTINNTVVSIDTDAMVSEENKQPARKKNNTHDEELNPRINRIAHLQYKKAQKKKKKQMKNVTPDNNITFTFDEKFWSKDNTPLSTGANTNNLPILMPNNIQPVHTVPVITTNNIQPPLSTGVNTNNLPILMPNNIQPVNTVPIANTLRAINELSLIHI